MDKEDVIETPEQPQEIEQEKATNRTYTQSEADRLVAKVTARVKEQYKDYDAIKSDYEKMKAELHDKEMAEKSELEKAQYAIEELKTKYEQANSKLMEVQREKMRDGVLLDPKFSTLPEIYKKNVKFSDNLDEIRQSADEILEQFQKDFGAKTSQTFGIPKPVINKKVEGDVNPDAIAMQLRERIHNMIKSRA